MLENLDAKGMDVFEAIHEAGGRAETGEVKDITGIEKNAVVLYRFDKLEEMGLIESETGEATGDRIPPRVAVLTDKAREKIQSGLFAEEEPTVVERMDRLERQFVQVVDEVHGLQSELREFRYDPEAEDELNMGELVEEVEAFREQVRKAEAVAEIEPARVERVAGRQGAIVRSLERLAEQVYEVADTVHEEGIEPSANLSDEDGFQAQRENPLEPVRGLIEDEEQAV